MVGVALCKPWNARGPVHPSIRGRAKDSACVSVCVCVWVCDFSCEQIASTDYATNSCPTTTSPLRPIARGRLVKPTKNCRSLFPSFSQIFFVSNSIKILFFIFLDDHFLRKMDKFYITLLVVVLIGSGDAARPVRRSRVQSIRTRGRQLSTVQQPSKNSLHFFCSLFTFSLLIEIFYLMPRWWFFNFIASVKNSIHHRIRNKNLSDE